MSDDPPQSAAPGPKAGKGPVGLRLPRIPDSFRSPRPPPAVRAILLAEVAAFVAVVTGVIWLNPAPGQAVQWYNVVLWVLAVLLAAGGNLLHGDRPRDSGLRVDNLGVSAREACIVTGILAAAVAVAGAATWQWHYVRWAQLARRAGEILAVAAVQQYVLQAFMLRRLRQAGLAPVLAVAVAAVLFGALHAPNIVLVGVTVLAATVWCTLFLRHANLLVLSASHGLLAVWLYCAWPKAWHLGMAVGPKALERMTRYWAW